VPSHFLNSDVKVPTNLNFVAQQSDGTMTVALRSSITWVVIQLQGTQILRHMEIHSNPSNGKQSV